MNRQRLAAHSRSQLHERFRKLGPARLYAPPIRGWIRAIRTALGMSTAQLAERLKIKVTTTPYPFSQADQALTDLAAERVHGAAVLQM